MNTQSPTDTPSSVDAVRRFIDEFALLYADEIAARLEAMSPSEAAEVLSAMDAQKAAQVLSRTSAQAVADVFLCLEMAKRVALLDAMEPARAVAVMIRVSKEDRAKTLSAMESAAGRELTSLLDYPLGSAGRMMDPIVLTMRPEETVDDALTEVRGLLPRRVFDVFVVDSDSRLVGSVGLQDLATAHSGTRLSEIARTEPARVSEIAGRDEIVEILESQKIPSLPVVDFEQRVVGVIRYDALIEAVEREASSDMQSMVGASREERALSRVSFAVRKRLPWLQVNLVTAFIAASVVGLFENTIAQFTALAVLLPVVAGQSGNTGAQALAVVMRGLSLREITARHWFKVLTKEGFAGIINGFAVASVTSVAVFFWSQSIGLAAVIGVSMVISMAMAAMAGAAIPILLKMIGQDPAQSSSIILTTVTDVAGFLSFLGLATLFSSIL